MATILHEKPKAAVEPAKAWANWWIVCVATPDCHLAYGLGVGDKYQDADTWPSKEICEQKAHEELQWDLDNVGFIPDAWLGAFPVDETP